MSDAVRAAPAALVTFGLYLAVIVSVGLALRRFSSRGVNEFFLGGRTLGPFIVALSAVATGRSAWLLLGVSGMAYMRGASAVWAVVGYILVELFLFAFVGRRLRRFTGRSGDLTVSDFFASRFGDRRLLRVVSAAIILVFMTAYVAAQLQAGGKALAASFLPRGGVSLLGVPMSAVTLGALITAAIIVAYGSTGGFRAVAINDTIQAVVILASLVLVPLVAAVKHPSGVARTLEALSPHFLDPLALSAGVLIGFIGIGLGSPGNPHILVRYMAIKEERSLAQAAFWGTFWNVVMGWGALWIGLLGRAHIPGSASLPGGDAETVYPLLAGQLLPSWLFGVVLASIFAAILTSADSQLLVAASALVRDLLQKTTSVTESWDERRLVRVSRACVVGLIVLAVILGTLAPGLVFTLVLFAWGGLGASFGPTVILALYWRRTTRWGVLAGLLSGTAVTVIWRLIPGLEAIVYELVPAFIVATILTVIVSLSTCASTVDSRSSD